MLDAMSDSIQRSRIENLHSWDVDRQSPTGLIFNYSVNILNESLRILIDCSELSKTYYNVLFGSSIRDHHA